MNIETQGNNDGYQTKERELTVSAIGEHVVLGVMSTGSTENMHTPEHLQDNEATIAEKKKLDILLRGDEAEFEKYSWKIDFPNLKLEYIIKKIIEAGKGERIANKLVETSNGRYVADNLDNFEGLDRQDIANKLVETFDFKEHLTKNPQILDKFNDSDELRIEIADKVIGLETQKQK